MLDHLYPDLCLPSREWKQIVHDQVQLMWLSSVSKLRPTGGGGGCTDSVLDTSDMTEPSRLFCFRFSRFLCAADLGAASFPLTCVPFGIGSAKVVLSSSTLPFWSFAPSTCALGDVSGAAVSS